MRIIIATVQIPFVSGGAESHAEGLKSALIAEGHDAEIVAVPFNPAVPERIPDQMLACRLLDLTEIHGTPVDRLIALKFPAYLIPHPNKVVWILHQHRAAYDLWNYPFEDLSASPRGVVVREAIRRADQQLAEAKAVFANSKTSRTASVISAASTQSRSTIRRRTLRASSAPATPKNIFSFPAACLPRNGRAWSWRRWH